MMRMRTGLVALLLLGLYATAVGHQVLPHDDDHGEPESCALCILFAGVAVVAGAVMLFLHGSTALDAFTAPVRVRRRPSWCLPYRRGPPEPPF